jgi:hypothetical protein
VRHDPELPVQQPRPQQTAAPHRTDLIPITDGNFFNGLLVSEKTVMHLRQIAESGSYARFFFELIAMYLIVSVLAFCLIAAAYA